MKYMEFKWYCLMKPMRGLEAKTGSSFSYVCIPWTLITTETRYDDGSTNEAGWDGGRKARVYLFCWEISGHLCIDVAPL